MLDDEFFSPFQRSSVVFLLKIMRDFHCQIRFQCFAFLKGPSSSAGQKIHSTLFLLSLHLYSQELQGRRYEGLLNLSLVVQLMYMYVCAPSAFGCQFCTSEAKGRGGNGRGKLTYSDLTNIFSSRVEYLYKKKDFFHLSPMPHVYQISPPCYRQSSLTLVGTYIPAPIAYLFVGWLHSVFFNEKIKEVK